MFLFVIKLYRYFKNNNVQFCYFNYSANSTQTVKFGSNDNHLFTVNSKTQKRRQASVSIKQW